MTKSKTPCNGCPFTRNSKRGHLTHQKNREGYRSTASGMLQIIKDRQRQRCHKIKCSELGDPKALCKGAPLFYENLEKRGTHENIFDNVRQFKQHHIFKKGIAPELVFPPIKEKE